MPLQLIQIESPHAFREYAQAWDDLWWQSETALPTKRAAMLLDWLHQSGATAGFHAIAVADGGRLLAALPLVEQRLARTIRIGKLPVNSWSSAGDLLLDIECDQSAVLNCLVEGIRGLPWPLVWGNTIEINEPRWQAFCTALAEAELPYESSGQFELGLIDIDHDWDAYRQRWSKNHRKQMDRCLRRAREQGELELTIHRDLSGEGWEPLLTEGFEVEDRSWKGAAGSSVLRAAGQLEFYLKQARLLAEWGQLELVFLRLDGWPIAFEFGYRSNGVYFSHKVGYDEAYRALGPGQLLMYLQLEAYHADPDCRLVNCMGILNAATANWCTRSRPIGRLLFGTGRPIGRAIVEVIRQASPFYRQVRTRMSGGPPDAVRPKLGASNRWRKPTGV